MKLKWTSVAAGATNFLACNKGMAYLVDMRSPSDAQLLRKFPSNINGRAYCEKNDVAIFSDLVGNLTCVQTSTGLELWRKNIKTPVGGLTIWENAGAVCVATPVPTMLHLQTGEKIETIWPTLHTANCRGGILFASGRQSYYARDLSMTPIELQESPYFKFAIELGRDFLLLEKFSPQVEELHLYDLRNGGLVKSAIIENCSILRSISFNAELSKVIIGGTLDDMSTGFWSCDNQNNISFIGGTRETGLLALSRGGDVAIFHSGLVEPIRTGASGICGD